MWGSRDALRFVAMPPKGSRKKKNDPAPTAIVEASAAPAFVVPDSSASHPANIKYLDNLARAWTTITNHPIFQNVTTMDPYQIDQASSSLGLGVCVAPGSSQ